MYRSIPKPPIPPPGKPPGIWFLWKISVKCLTMSQFRRSNAPPVRASRRVKSPTLQICYHRFRWYATLDKNAPRKRFQNFRQSCVLSPDRIEIHQSQPLVWPSGLLYVMLAGCDWWISIRSVDNIFDWGKFWKRFRGYFVFESRVSTKTVVSNCTKAFSTRKTVYSTEQPTSNRREQWPLNVARVLNQRIAKSFRFRPLTTLGARGFFFFFVAKLRLWAAKPRPWSCQEKRKPSGRGSYKPHFHAILKPNTSPNRFLRDRFAFVINMYARVATMRETAQNKLSQDARKSETVRSNITYSIEARQSFNSFM